MVKKQEVKTIEIAGGDEVNVGDSIALTADVENGHEAGCLTGGGQHGAHAAFQIGNLFFHIGHGGVGNTGIHMTGRFQIKQLAQFGCAVVLVGSALVDGHGSGLAVLGLIAGLDALGFEFHMETSRVKIKGQFVHDKLPSEFVVTRRTVKAAGASS